MLTVISFVKAKRSLEKTSLLNFSSKKIFSPSAYFERSYHWWSSGGMEITSSTAFSGSLAVIVSLLLVFKGSVSCCRSRNGFDKKAPRTTLMKEAFIPDVPETSVQASGPAKGKITNSSEFAKLKRCYNGDIIFKDGERTVEDHLMSKVERLSFVYIIYFAFHHCQCSANTFLWGLWTLIDTKQN